MNESKEIKNIIEAIDKYIKKHKGNVEFYCSFMAFKGENFDVVDDRMFVYGVKESLLLAIKDMQEQVKKDKEEFINWYIYREKKGEK